MKKFQNLRWIRFARKFVLEIIPSEPRGLHFLDLTLYPGPRQETSHCFGNKDVDVDVDAIDKLV